MYRKLQDYDSRKTSTGEINETGISVNTSFSWLTGRPYMKPQNTSVLLGRDLRWLCDLKFGCKPEEALAEDDYVSNHRRKIVVRGSAQKERSKLADWSGSIIHNDVEVQCSWEDP